jgi:hypothetical protein
MTSRSWTVERHRRFLPAFLRAILAILAIPAALALPLLVSCGARQPIEGNKAKAETDRKLSTFAFIEEGKLVTLIVDTRATGFREDDPYIPLEIAISNNGLRQLRITRESFTLVDEQGNRYPAAGPEELVSGYKWLDLDRNALAELDGIVFNKFAAFTRYPSKFSPTTLVAPGTALASGNDIVRDLVSLPKFGYMLDFIYFPQPAGGLKTQRFELFLDSQDLEDPVFVRFIVK